MGPDFMLIYKTLQCVSALNFSEHILKNYGSMSHLKLQKLLYYCQAYHLAEFDVPLLKEEFQAWVHGPVCIEVYHSMKDQSPIYSDLRHDEKFDPDPFIRNVLTEKQLELIDDVVSELKEWKDSELENATHKEWPWREARKDLPNHERCTNVISLETMRDYYKKELGNRGKASEA